MRFPEIFMTFSYIWIQFHVYAFPSYWKWSRKEPGCKNVFVVGRKVLWEYVQ